MSETIRGVSPLPLAINWLLMRGESTTGELTSNFGPPMKHAPCAWEEKICRFCAASAKLTTVALAPGPAKLPALPVAFGTARFSTPVPRPLQFGLESVWIGTPTTSPPHPLRLALGFDPAQVEMALLAHPDSVEGAATTTLPAALAACDQLPSKS